MRGKKGVNGENSHKGDPKYWLCCIIGKRTYGFLGKFPKGTAADSIVCHQNMKNITPPFKFDISNLVLKARGHIQKRVEGVSINLPFVTFSVRPDDIEKKIAREIVIRLADKRVLNAFECCDSCVKQALSSLHEIRTLLVDKQVELANQTNGSLYLVLEFMAEAIRQFFTFIEKSGISEADLHEKFQHRQLEKYFSALEMLRGHLYRCLNQVAVIADTTIPKISENMRYKDDWQLGAYTEDSGTVSSAKV